MNVELSNLGAKVRGSNISQKIASKFRRDKEEREQIELNSLTQRVYGYVCVIAVILVAGFLIGWFSSLFHHSPSSPSELDGVAPEAQPGQGDDNSSCQPEGMSQRGHTCGLIATCRYGQLVEEACPKFQSFDTKTSLCQWIHLADCKDDRDDNAPSGGIIIEEPDVVVVPDVPEPPILTVPTLQQVLDTEARIISKHGVSRARENIRTLSQNLVDQIRPGRADNPENVQILESIVSEKNWEFMFPLRNEAYTYRGFLQAVGKFPAFCASKKTCPLSLAVIFAHFTQETGAHDGSQGYPQWRQGLYFVEEAGCSNRDCGYSSNCRQKDSWLVKTWPCQRDENGQLNSYHGRGAKQISYNYNYGQFSSFMFGDPLPLLKDPELVATTWLALASAIWFFLMPQPPKPSMLEVVDGTWVPNQADLAAGLEPGFGVTTNIINGGIECGKGSELAQSKNRQEYFRHFASKLGSRGWKKFSSCSTMKAFSDKGAGSQMIYWEQDWARNYHCKLVSYQTSFSALVPGNYQRCVVEKFSVEITK